MLLCLDIGNTHIYGGLFENEILSFQFRYPSKDGGTSDELGIFLKNYLREMNLDPASIKSVAFCSVVPSLEYSIRSAFIKYFSLTPFVLQANVKTDLHIHYKNPSEVGTDRLANAIGAYHHFPQKNIIITDLGTATTFEAISEKGVFLGGAIIPGLPMQMRALNEYTANLPPVRIIKTEAALGQCTTSNIQAGLYYGLKGAIRTILESITSEVFDASPPILIGTGGFSYLYQDEKLFDMIMPDLVLQGLRIAYHENN